MSDPTDRPAPTRHREVETKLEADPGFQLPALGADPRCHAAGVAAADRPETLQLDAVYYDTEQLDLLRSRLTLRRRTGGGDAGWHLKVPAGAGARTEVRLPLAAGEGGDGGRVPATLRALVLGAARGRALRPVARIRTARSTCHLLDAGGTSLVEIADDRVSGAGLLPGVPDEQHWREVEVELTGGSPEHLAAVVDALTAAGARASASASKLGRLLGVAGTVSRVPDRAVTGTPGKAVPAVTGTPGNLVLGGYLTRHRDLLIDADVRLRNPDPDAEAAHDARAAARRIRSVLRVFRQLLASDEAGAGIDAVIAALREAGAALAPVRDADVALGRLDAMLVAPAGSADDAAAPGAGTLRARLAARREAALPAMRAALSSDGYLTLLRSLDMLADIPVGPSQASPSQAGPSEPLPSRSPSSQSLPSEVLRPPVAAAWRRLLRHAEGALALTQPGNGPAVPGPAQRDGDHAGGPDGDARLHRVRKDAKTVRYAAEAAAGAGGPFGTAMATFASEMERLQELLGEHQDAVTASALVDDLAGQPGITAAERHLLDRWRRVESERRASTREQFVRGKSDVADAWNRSFPLP